MNNKKLFSVAMTAFLLLVIASCQREVFEAPVISGIENEYLIKEGTTLEITPNVLNKEDIVYEWLINGTSVSKEEKLVFTETAPNEYKVILKVTTKGGTSQAAFIIRVYGKYTYGTFVLSEGNMSNETGTLSFIDPEGASEDSIFYKANEGKKLGNVCQDMAIANGKVYIISQNGNKNGGLGKLVIADAGTLKMEAVVDAGLEGWTTNIAVPNDKYAYVVSVTKPKGIIPIDLNTRKAGAPIPDTEEASKLKMASIDGKLFAAAGKRLLVIDGSTAKILKTVDVAEPISGVSTTVNQNVRVITAKGKDVVLTTINAKDYSVIGTKTISDLGIPNSLTSAFACDTKDDESSYIVGAEGWSVNKLVRYSGGAANPFLTLPSDAFSNTGMFYGPISVNPETGNIYFGYVKGWGMDYLNNGVGIISPDGNKVFDYNSQNTTKKIDTRFCAGIYFTNPYSPKK